MPAAERECVGSRLRRLCDWKDDSKEKQVAFSYVRACSYRDQFAQPERFT